LGLDDAAVRQTAATLVGDGARVVVRRQAGQATVTVEQPVNALGIRLTAKGQAVAACEPDRGCG
jgi:NAD/NADP transhydrogenase alpha subunit